MSSASFARVREMLAPPSPPLAHRRVVVTRAARQAPELTSRLRQAGAEVVECPVIESLPVSDLSMLDEALATLDGVDWIVFTSANAVSALFDRASATGNRERLTGTRPRFAAVGPATAAALGAWGATVSFVPSEHHATAVALGLPASRGHVVLLPRSDIAPPDLPDALRRRGLVVREIVAYRTGRVTSPDTETLLRAVSADAITFTSASAARAFLDAIEGDPRTAAIMSGPGAAAIVCLGPQTAAAVRHRGWHVDAVATTHTLEGLIDVLADFYARERIQRRA